MLPDLRHALRSLRRSPGYTAVTLATLMLGVGANTAVFSIVRGVLLSPLPYAQPDRLVQVEELNGSGRPMQAAWRNFTDWRDASTLFDGLAAYTPSTEATVLGTAEALRARTTRVSDGFFRTLGTDVMLGRVFVASEHELHGPPAVVISDAFWRTHFGAERDLSRLRLTVAGFDAQVIGVLPHSRAYPAETDLWLPLELSRQSESRTAHNYRVIGRLRTDVTQTAAKAELDAITAGFADRPEDARDRDGLPDFFPFAANVTPLHEAIVGDVATALWILLGAALLVMLVACTNLASTGLARGTAREREYAIRHALGARRGRLIGVAFGEMLVLALAGGALGILGATLVIRVLPALAPAGIPRLADVTIDGSVLAFTLLLSLACAAAAGALPGLRIAGSAMRSLRAGGRAGDEPRRQRIWKTLIAAEMALALTLLIGAGLLLRSFQSLLSVDPGYHTRGVLTVTLDPPPSKYATPDDRRRYYESVVDALRAIPGAEAVGIIAAPPFAPLGNGLLQVEHEQPITADYQLADAGFFRVMGVPLLAGRVFDDREREADEHVAVVNRSFADAAWPGSDPIGRRVSGGGMDNFGTPIRWATVIGVVGDVRQRELAGEPRPTAYFAFRQRPFRSWSMTAVLASAGSRPPATLITPARDAIRNIDRDVPVRFLTIEERLSTAVAGRRFILLVITVFAASAVVLASVGVYGVVSYAVERRRREIGIRLALGARPAQVRNAVQRDYLFAGAAGALAGVLLALMLARVMTSLLFGIEAADPTTFVAVLLTLGTTLWLASYVPSLRCTRVSPLETMRSD